MNTTFKTRVPNCTLVQRVPHALVWLRDGKVIASARKHTRGGIRRWQVKVPGYAWVMTKERLDALIAERPKEVLALRTIFPVGTRSPVRSFNTRDKADREVARVLAEMEVTHAPA